MTDHISLTLTQNLLLICSSVHVLLAQLSLKVEPCRTCRVRPAPSRHQSSHYCDVHKVLGPRFLVRAIPAPPRVGSCNVHNRSLCSHLIPRSHSRARPPTWHLLQFGFFLSIRRTRLWCTGRSCMWRTSRCSDQSRLGPRDHASSVERECCFVFHPRSP
jgi:hypothetical protein